MKRLIFGFLLVLGVFITGCSDETGVDDTVFYNKKKKEIYFRVNEGYDEATDYHWRTWYVGDDLKIVDFLHEEPKLNTNYSITISGTVNKDLNVLKICFASYSPDKDVWYGLTDWIQNIFIKRIPAGSFSETFTLRTSWESGESYGYDENVDTSKIIAGLYLYIYTDDPVPAGFTNGQIIATIKNFSMTITEIEG
jgi:hypothetical protein